MIKIIENLFYLTQSLDDTLPNSGKSQISKKIFSQNFKDLSNPQKNVNHNCLNN